MHRMFCQSAELARLHREQEITIMRHKILSARGSVCAEVKPQGSRSFHGRRMRCFTSIGRQAKRCHPQSCAQSNNMGEGAAADVAMTYEYQPGDFVRIRDRNSRPWNDHFTIGQTEPNKPAQTAKVRCESAHLYDVARVEAKNATRRCRSGDGRITNRIRPVSTLCRLIGSICARVSRFGLQVQQKNRLGHGQWQLHSDRHECITRNDASITHQVQSIDNGR